MARYASNVPILRMESVAENTTEVTLDVSDTDFSFNAGQYARITLPGLDDKPLPQQFHDFSIVSSPLETDTISFATRNSDSTFKRHLLHMQPGAKVLLEGPFGVLTLPENSHIPLYLVAAGIGITPALSMLRFTEQMHSRRHITLFYFNRSKSSVAYMPEISGFVQHMPNFRLRVTTGPITRQSFDGADNLPNGLWYITGPPKAVTKARAELHAKSILDEYIRVEEFSGYHG